MCGGLSSDDQIICKSGILLKTHSALLILGGLTAIVPTFLSLVIQPVLVLHILS